MDYKINRIDMLHEGGTKFYSIYGIEVNEKAVVLGNWGKRGIAWTEFGNHDIKIVSGSFILYKGSLDAMKDAASDLLLKKKGRGYKRVGGTVKTFLFSSKEKLIAHIKFAFGKHADDILEHLKLEEPTITGTGEVKTIIHDELVSLQKISRVKHTPMPITEDSERPVAWGSW